jgi:hypothetical protein
MCDETVSSTQGSPGSAKEAKEPCGKPCARRRIILTPGLPSKKLLERIILHLRGGDAEDRAAAFYLREFEERCNTLRTQGVRERTNSTSTRPSPSSPRPASGFRSAKRRSSSASSGSSRASPRSMRPSPGARSDGRSSGR